MENLQEEITNTLDDTQDVENLESDKDQPTGDDPQQTSDEENQDDAIELWKGSNEFKNGMWKSADDIYKSVQYYQQKYTPFEQALNKHGYKTPQDFEQVLGLLPDYQKSYQMINNLHTLMSDPELAKPLEDAFRAIKRQQEIRQYGIATGELPPQVQERLNEFDSYKKQLDEMKSEKQTQEQTKIINEQVSSIVDLCNKYSFDFDINQFIAHCAQNDVNPSYIKAYFIDNYFDKIMQGATNQASLNAVNQNKKAQNGAISTSNRQKGIQAPKAMQTSKDLKNELLNVLGNN